MSTPTKVFVVLLVIFSITFTMMTVQYVARSTQWKDQATKYRQLAFAAAVHQRNVMAMSTAAQEMLQATINRMNQDLVGREGELAALQDQLGDVQQQLGETQLALSISSARETIQTNSWKAEKSRADINEEQRRALRQETDELRQRNIDLNARVSELTTTVALLRTQVLGLQEQNYALRSDLDKLQAGAQTAAGPMFNGTAVTGASDRVEPVQSSVGGAIRGAIASVRDDIASIDVGSADGVQSGMIFVISRNGDYIGTLTISDLRPNEAGGRLSDLGNNLTVLPGDRVIDEQGLLGGK